MFSHSKDNHCIYVGPFSFSFLFIIAFILFLYIIQTVLFVPEYTFE